MPRIRQLRNQLNIWGVFDKRGVQLLSIQKKIPECEIREYSAYPQGRGRLLTVFLGSDAFDRACAWAKSYSTERELLQAGVLAEPRTGTITSGERAVRPSRSRKSVGKTQKVLVSH